MAKTVKNKGVEEPTPSLKEDNIEESVMTTSDMVKSNVELEPKESDELLVIVHDPRFSNKPHTISRRTYEVLRNQEIEIEICK